MLSLEHMKARQQKTPRFGERGFTIIELMIVMIVAIIILVAVSKSFLGGLSSQRMQSELIRTQESARFAFELLSRSIRHSGYRNTYAIYPTTYNLSVFPVEFCGNSAVSSIGSQLSGSNDPLTIDPAASNFSGSAVTVLNRSDVLRVRFYGEDNPDGTAADGSVVDCLGNSIRRAGNTTSGVPIAETFYVASDSTGEPALFCNTTFNNTNTAQPLVSGVESMQILYGEDTDGDGVVNRYVSYNNVTDPDNVFSIMISLVIRTTNDIDRALVQESVREFNQLGTTVTLPGSDNRFRRQFTSTITLRNFRQC